MRIEHLALWVRDLEAQRAFYCRWLGAEAGGRYHNPRKGFTSYFLTFAGGARLELMQMPGLTEPGQGTSQPPGQQFYGWAHLALALGSREKVDALTGSGPKRACLCWTAPAPPAMATTKAQYWTRRAIGWS
jgi:lactoylglutathione lyase